VVRRQCELALDPESLPLKTTRRRFSADLFNPPLGIFDDALPDDWGSSRAGGARPKALVHNAEGEWLVKFPSQKRDGPHDVIGLEATCLELARRAGLEVPESHLQNIGRRRTLVVRRFDITPQNGRLHMISLRTLCLERPGVYVQAYSDLAQAVGKHSAAPKLDVATLFRHMVFNAAVGNVDDHRKNFWMLAKPGGYRLAPAFDLLPDITGRVEHTLSFRSSFACPNYADLMTIADEWKVGEAGKIISRVTGAVRSFATTAKKLAVHSGASLENICADIRGRLKAIGD
jgi:serine/threonine-protein kinase HipA